MFTEKEIAIASADQKYTQLRQAYKDLACFLECDAKITFNAIRIGNGLEANPEFEKLIDGTDPTPPEKDDYREKRKYIRQNNAGMPDRTPADKEEELKKKYPELGFGDLNERKQDLPDEK